MTDDQLKDELKLYIDHTRAQSPETGIFVRAINPTTERYESVDIAHIDHASLMRWLRSRGGENQWAENCVALLLGHARFQNENDPRYENAVIVVEPKS